MAATITAAPKPGELSPTSTGGVKQLPAVKATPAKRNKIRETKLRQFILTQLGLDAWDDQKVLDRISQIIISPNLNTQIRFEDGEEQHLNMEENSN